MTLPALFVTALVLKVGSAIVAWFIQDPVFMGFCVPLGVMLAYLLLGWQLVKNGDRQALLNYGDSAYYLGFLFTIASIILALMDLSRTEFAVGDVATRFAVAMLTTLLGMAIRVYFVTFAEQREKEKAKQKHKKLLEEAKRRGAKSGRDGRDGVDGEDPDAPDGFTRLTPQQEQIVPVDKLFGTEEEDLAYLTNANISNLRTMGQSIIACINDFERLRVLLNNMSGRVRHDLEEGVEIVRKSQMEMLERTRDHLTQMGENFEEKLAKSVEDTGEKLAKSVEDTGETVRAAFDEQIRKTSDLADQSLSVLLETNKSVGDEIKSHASTLGSAVHDASGELNRSVSRLATGLDKSAAKLATGLDESTARLTSGLDESTARLTNEIDRSAVKLVNQFDKSVADMSGEMGRSITGMTTEMGRTINGMTADLGRSVANLTTNFDQTVTGVTTGLNHSVSKFSKDLVESFEPEASVKDSLNRLNQTLEALSDDLRRKIERIELPDAYLQKSTAQFEERLNGDMSKIRGSIDEVVQELAVLKKTIAETAEVLPQKRGLMGFFHREK